MSRRAASRAAEVFRRAIERGEIPADTKIEVALDMLYGPLYHRLLHGHAPLNDRFVRDVVDTALDGIMHGPPARGSSLRAAGPVTGRARRWTPSGPRAWRSRSDSRSRR